MKKQETHAYENTVKTQAGKDNSSRVLLIVAVVLYSVSLILLANLALADTKNVGALIKVNNKLDGSAFAQLDVDVKTVSGNILAVNLPLSNMVNVSDVAGICAHNRDVNRSDDAALDMATLKAKYAGTGVVVGVLDNMGVLRKEAYARMKKVEKRANVGFVSYVNNDASSTVVMRNLVNGESNLIQALIYMAEYAKTVERPLIVELRTGSEEMRNSLFVQACQKFADTGVQFLGTNFKTSNILSSAPLQFAFSMFDAKTGEMKDQSDFWAIEEVKGQHIMLLGTDSKTCTVGFQTESGFDKVFMSNNSSDIVMITTISADGNVNYYHIKNKNSALIPRELANGTPMLEDGLGGVYPYHSKGVLFNGAVADKQFLTLSSNTEAVSLSSGMEMEVASQDNRTLQMSLSKLNDNLSIEIKDENGSTVYRNQPGVDTQSISTRINLSSGDGGLYFLDLTSPEFHQTFALLID